MGKRIVIGTGPPQGKHALHHMNRPVARAEASSRPYPPLPTQMKIDNVSRQSRCSITPCRVASFITIAQHGPALWTGGGFGPDGGILVTLAFLLGMLPIFLYIRWRYGKVGIDTSLARFDDAVSESESETSLE